MPKRRTAAVTVDGKPWFAVNLVAAMEARGIANANQLAKLLDVDRSTAVRWVRGQVIPEGANLTMLCKALGVEARDLLEEPGTVAERRSRAVAFLRAHGGDPEAQVAELMSGLSDEDKRRLVARVEGWIEGAKAGK